MNRFSLLGFTLTGALALSACGSSGPDVSQTKQDFNSPSGSVNDEQTVAAAYGSNQASGPATRIAGGASAGFGGLTASGVKGLERLNAAHILRPHILAQARAVQTGTEVGQVRLGLVEEDVQALSGCYSGAGVSGDASGGSIDVTMDLSSCTEDLTGSVVMTGDFSRSDTKIEYTLKQTFNQVCEKSGQEACVDGTFVIEMVLDLGNLNVGGDIGSGDASAGSLNMEYNAAWDVKATWKENGNSLSGTSKGGMRMVLDETTKQAVFEFLAYVKDSTGKEVSVVLSIKSGGEGATFTIKGSDGEVSCQIASDGSGSCTGDGKTLEWTAEEAKAHIQAGLSFEG